MNKRKTGRVAWTMVAILAAAVLVGIGALGICLKPYLVARYRGYGADLRGAVLIRAPLRGACLMCANLQGAKLRGADLRNARLESAKLRKADLQGALLQGAELGGGCIVAADLTGADLRGADLRGIALEWYARRGARCWLRLPGARCDAHTRWPEGFDPVKAGAVKE